MNRNSLDYLITKVFNQCMEENADLDRYSGYVFFIDVVFEAHMADENMPTPNFDRIISLMFKQYDESENTNVSPMDPLFEAYMLDEELDNV